MHTLVVLRHGESLWNEEGRFTGWTDVDLSARGLDEAHPAATLLLKEGFAFVLAFTSVLKRIPVERSWRLNERHYGATPPDVSRRRNAAAIPGHRIERLYTLRHPRVARDELDAGA